MYRSLSAGSPHVMESDCTAGSRVWSDLLFWRSNRSEYLHGRYAWIRGASSRPQPSRFLHLEHTSSGGPSSPRATCILTILASCGEGLLTESCYRQAGSGAEVLQHHRLQCCRLQCYRPQCRRLLRWCHPCASHSHPLGVSQQPPTSRWCNCQVSLRGGESPSTPLLINLQPWAVKMPMVMGGKELEAEMITSGPPVPPMEHVKGPPLG